MHQGKSKIASFDRPCNRHNLRHIYILVFWLYLCSFDLTVCKHSKSLIVDFLSLLNETIYTF